MSGLSRIIADNASSFCQPTFNQIKPLATLLHKDQLTSYLFCMYTHGSLSNLSCVNIQGMEQLRVCDSGDWGAQDPVPVWASDKLCSVDGHQLSVQVRHYHYQCDDINLFIFSEENDEIQHSNGSTYLSYLTIICSSISIIFLSIR